MLILGIETSCDETSVAVVRDGVTVLSNVISSSRKTFEALAGVIPEQAARMQIECMIPVLERALSEARVTMKEIDAIAVTRGPGLLGSLLVGTVTARALAAIHRKPLIGVHHTLGHLSSPWLDGGLTLPPSPGRIPAFPVLTLSVSGGHSDLWLRTSHVTGELIGRTRDDAAGEAFDKGASMLALPYPGGPSIERAARTGNERAYDFPLPLHGEDTLDFSFSGLKTSLKYLLRDQPDAPVPDAAASFQYAICRHLVHRLQKAIHRHPGVQEVHIVGGVSANARLRQAASDTCAEISPATIVRVPATLAYCTDNAAMIASAGEFIARELGDGAYATFATAASLPLAASMPGLN